MTDNNDITLTEEETKRLEDCFRDKEFRDLLNDYVREISNPSTKMAYEQYLQQIERDGGSPQNRKLMKPVAAFCIKAKLFESDKRKHLFINICSGNLVQDAKLTNSTGFDHELNCSGAKKAGLCWQIPYILGLQRFDANDGALIYDIAFSSATITLLDKDSSFKRIVIQTAIEAVDGIQNEYKLYQNQCKKYKILNTTKHKGEEPPLMSVHIEEADRMIDIKKMKQRKIKYKIVESEEKMNITDCWSDCKLSIDQNPQRLKQIYIIAELQNVKSITEIDLKFTNNDTMLCIAVKDNKYEKCEISLKDYPFIASSMNASWYKHKKELKITLDIKPKKIQQIKKKLVISDDVDDAKDIQDNEIKEVKTKRITRKKKECSADDIIDNHFCHHKIPMKLVTNNNNGKSYWICCKSQTEKCTAFAWNKNKNTKRQINEFEIEKREKLMKTVLLIRIRNILQDSVNISFEKCGRISIEFEDHEYKYHKNIDIGFKIDTNQSRFDLNCRNLLIMTRKHLLAVAK